MVAPPGWIAKNPLVSVAGFKAHPTYLDLNNLRSGDLVAADQNAELLNILLEASEIAQWTICRQPLQGNIQTTDTTGYTDRRGRLRLKPDYGPVRRLTSISYGTSYAQSPVSVTSPAYRVVDGNIHVELQNSGSSWSGALQLGTPSPAAELDVTYTYVAGFGNGVLTAQASAAATSLTIDDPTGIEPGDILRVWDPGTEETVQVAASYSPAPSSPPVPTAIPLTAALAFTHAVGVQVSGVPLDAYTGVIFVAIDLLQRPASSTKVWPGSKGVRAATKQGDQPSSVSYQRATNLLGPYANPWM